VRKSNSTTTVWLRIDQIPKMKVHVREKAASRPAAIGETGAMPTAALAQRL